MASFWSGSLHLKAKSKDFFIAYEVGMANAKVASIRQEVYDFINFIFCIFSFPSSFQFKYYCFGKGGHLKKSVILGFDPLKF